MALKPRQYELMEVLLANPMESDVAIARAMNLNNKTVGVWRKMPEFQEEYKKRLQEQWKNAESIAQRTMIDLACEGDFKASKYILDSLGYAPAQKIEADVSTNININVEE